MKAQSDDEAVSKLLIDIKSLDTKKAKISANAIENIKLKELALGYMRSELYREPTEINSTENSPLGLLVKGNNSIYQNDTASVEAFKLFSEALGKSQRTNNDEVTKASLFAILKLLGNQIFIGTNQFEIYLEHLRELRSDIYDEIKLAFFEVKLYSKANDSLEVNGPKYTKAVGRMDSIFSTLSKNNTFWPYYYHEKGVQYKLNQEFQLSEYFFLKVDSIAKSVKIYKKLYDTNLWQLADMYMKSGDLEQAQIYLNFSKAKSSNLKDKYYDDGLASALFLERKDYDSAYYYLKKAMEAEYKLGSKNFSFVANQMSEFNRNDKLQLDNLKLDTERKQNQNWLIAASVALLLGTGIAVLLQKNTTRKKQLAEQEALLKQQKVENLLKEQELVSIDAMIAGQEKERQKVAGELHDDLGSLMATIKLHFDNAEVGKKDPALQNAQKLLEEAYQKIRGMAHSKNSGVMSDQGLLAAIKKMAKTITETDALEVTVEDFGLGERMENSLELSIFRMVQELVANAIKHAEASKVNIQLTQHEDSLNIIVEDNGKGFDRSQLDKGRSGMGLTSIEKRIEHLEGNFTVDSILDKGTSILIDIPV